MKSPSPLRFKRYTVRRSRLGEEAVRVFRPIRETNCEVIEAPERQRPIEQPDATNTSAFESILSSAA